MIHICDDFFEDPHKVRSIALKQKYVTERLNYPGIRCLDVPEEITDYILSYVRYITKKSSLTLTTSVFHSITKEFGDGIFHGDFDYDYICINYLSLGSHLHCGTEICDYDSFSHWGQLKNIMLYDEKTTKIQHAFHKNPFNLINRYRYGRIRKKINSYYQPDFIVSNKFNRCVMFPSRNFHRAQNFFGTSLENSRLTIVSFMNKNEI